MRGERARARHGMSERRGGREGGREEGRKGRDRERGRERESERKASGILDIRIGAMVSGEFRLV